jgi:hypothetical protein
MTRTRELGTATKLAGFAAVLAVVFGGAWAAGARVGPVGADAGADPGHGSGHGPDGRPHEAGEDPVSGTTRTQTQLPGLAVAQDGYRLVLAETVLDPGARSLAFRIDGPDGRPVTAFDVEHEKRLHLVVVRRDHTGFQHLHPVLDPTTGTWTARAALTPGSWRVFADFTARGGPPVVLGSDLLVPGTTSAPPRTGKTRADVVDGYTVTVDGALRPGDHAELVLRVVRAGEPVTDLQPYLGAYGHLVALREGDLAYLHVHPGGEPGDGRTAPGPDVAFGVEVPSAGRYHLYLDFRHRGAVRTAHLVLDAGGTTPAGHTSGHTHP